MKYWGLPDAGTGIILRSYLEQDRAHQNVEYCGLTKTWIVEANCQQEESE